jgi:hypothetical protein
LKKEDKEHEEAIKREVNAKPPSYPYIEHIPYINYNEGIIVFMWDKKKGKTKYTRRMTTHGSTFTSSRRSLINKIIIRHIWMGERCHYEWMGLFPDLMFRSLDFLRAHAPGK